MIKYMLKKFTRFFVILTDEDKGLAAESVRSALIIDTGTYPHLKSTILKVKENFSSAKVSILTFPTKEPFLRENFPEAEIVFPGASPVPNRYKFFFQMRRLRNKGFDVVVLMSLDISSGFAALSSKGKGVRDILLYNRWDETYLMRFRTFSEFISCKEGADVKVKRVASCDLGILWRITFFIPNLCMRAYKFLCLIFAVMFIFVRKDVKNLFRKTLKWNYN